MIGDNASCFVVVIQVPSLEPIRSFTGSPVRRGTSVRAAPVTTRTRKGVRLLVSTLVPKITINLHASSFKARLRALENTLGVMNGARYPTADEVKGGAAHSKSLSESVRRVTSAASS